MRFNIYLPDDLVTVLDKLAAGRSRSAAVRDAILLAARFSPVLRQLDRIEALLKGVSLTNPGPPAIPLQGQDSADVLQRTMAAEPAGFIDDD